MTHTTFSPEDIPPHITLNRLIDRHGIWTILRALAAATLQRRNRASADALPDHLRRDLGLPERGQDPPALRGPWL